MSLRCNSQSHPHRHLLLDCKGSKKLAISNFLSIFLHHPTFGTLHLTAVHKCVSDCEFIDILQLIAKANTTSYGRNLDIGEGLEAAHKVEERGLALDRG